MEKVLEVRDVCKYYGKLAANRNVNLSVGKGTIHSIVGENGAGKSTLMNILSGIVTPSSGEILLRGKKVFFRDANDSTRQGIGMVQQEFMLFNKLNAVENIIMGFEDVKHGCMIDYEKSRKRIEGICREYGFHFNLNEKVGNLPIVLQQQVEIVKVLFRDAEILIFDEPTAVLPPQEIEGLFKAFRFLKAKGHTILFITHKLKEVLAISDDITIMKDGQVVATMPCKEATERKLTNMMVGRDVMLTMQKHPVISDEKVLEVKDLVAYDDMHVQKVNGVSLSLRKGEILGLVGISGNGQNELVESITGMKDYEGGSILLHGKPLEKCSPYANRLHHMGYIPQDRIAIGCSVRSNLVDNAMMGTHLRRFKKHKIFLDYGEGQKFAASVVDKYSVKTQGLNDKAGSLSGGNLQKLIVGREFSQDNSVLVVEDPTRGIDVGSIEFIWNEILKQVEREGVSVLLITYDLHEAMELSDRIMVIYEGKIRKEFVGPTFDENEIGFYMLGGEGNEN